MDFEHLCNSGLNLGLDYMERPKDQKVTSDHQYFPSLTLALSLEPSSFQVDVESKSSVILENQVSSMSAVSSLSNSNIIKSRRDVDTRINQQLQVRRLVVDHDEDQSEAGRIKKLRLDTYQSRILEDSFNDHSTLNLKQKQALARRLDLRPRQVEVWYQNRRARNKVKQTEMECEMLKKCNERLKDENRRLQKEVQQLKATVVAKKPHYMP